MRILSAIYLNKAYPCIIHLNYVQEFIYDIFNYKWDKIKREHIRDSNLNVGDKTAKINYIVLDEIRKFYNNLGLIEPMTHDFIPYVVSMGNEIYVEWNHGTYSVVAGEKERGATLVKELSYEKAIERARAIVSLCEMK